MTLTESKCCPLQWDIEVLSPSIGFVFAPDRARVTRGWRAGTPWLQIYEILRPVGAVAAGGSEAGALRERS
jgi:hypothetical protein